VFRAILIGLLLYLIVRNFARVVRPTGQKSQAKGTPRSLSGRIDESRIQDANFKDISEK
jgi:hypothetical protein